MADEKHLVIIVEDTAPSKRLAALSDYHKGRSSRAQAPRILEKVGLARVREACPRFSEWLAGWEQLSPRPGEGVS